MTDKWGLRNTLNIFFLSSADARTLKQGLLDVLMKHLAFLRLKSFKKIRRLGAYFWAPNSIYMTRLDA